MDVNSQQNYQPNPQIYVPPSNELGQMYKESPENNSNYCQVIQKYHMDFQLFFEFI